MKKKCSRCRKRRRRANDQRWSRRCHNEYQRGWGPKHRVLTPAQKLKANARAYANVYQKRGKLKKPSRCEECRKRRKLEKHHPDHKEPLKVRWLCAPCHKAVEKNAA